MIMKLQTLYKKLKKEIDLIPEILRFQLNCSYCEKHKTDVNCTCFIDEKHTNFSVNVYEKFNELNIENIIIKIKTHLNTKTVNTINSIEV